MLPRLIYLADVPVESSYHGSALIYRLLENYPPGHLTIIETGTESQSERRLNGVRYLYNPLSQTRLMNTRFHPYMVAFFSRAAKKAQHIIDRLKNVEFDSVLTVAHGFGWLAAARLAETRGVPLHLIVHDDWPRVADVPSGLRQWLDECFGTVYRQAKTRMCVSPSMRNAYFERYGEEAYLLYPTRADRCPDFTAPPVRLGQSAHRFTVAFAGSINTSGYVEALRALHASLEPVGGRLLVFGPLTPSEASDAGLNLANIVLCGFVNWPELIRRLREEVDALFVPMSFTVADRLNMEMAFPSKLADYTAVGLPLLIYGPEYCSAVRWAKENPGASEVVTTEGTIALGNAVERLASSPSTRVLLGMRALEVGRRDFSSSLVRDVFNHALLSTDNPTSITPSAALCSTP